MSPVAAAVAVDPAKDGRVSTARRLLPTKHPIAAQHPIVAPPTRSSWYPKNLPYTHGHNLYYSPFKPHQCTFPYGRSLLLTTYPVVYPHPRAPVHLGQRSSLLAAAGSFHRTSAARVAPRPVPRRHLLEPIEPKWLRGGDGAHIHFYWAGATRNARTRQPTRHHTKIIDRMLRYRRPVLVVDTHMT